MDLKGYSYDGNANIVEDSDSPLVLRTDAQATIAELEQKLAKAEALQKQISRQRIRTFGKLAELEQKLAKAEAGKMIGGLYIQDWVRRCNTFEMENQKLQQQLATAQAQLKRMGEAVDLIVSKGDEYSIHAIQKILKAALTAAKINTKKEAQ